MAHNATSATPADGLSDLELTNAEALADDIEIELPEVTIVCDRGPTGRWHDRGGCTGL
ncbi:MAG: hypothetical protein HDR92_10835 [Bacteroides sp.]|nr:hypothetical protein [Bacteroides sp.]